MELTLHFLQRGAQRNLSIEDVEYIIRHGECHHRAGAVFYYLRKRDVPLEDQRNERIRQLIGTAVVLARDCITVITIWRNRRSGLKRIKQKPKFDIPRRCR